MILNNGSIYHQGKSVPKYLVLRFSHSRYDEAEVSKNVFIVHMKYAPTPSLMVTPRGKKFGGNIWSP